MKLVIPAATALFLLTLANASHGAVIYLDLAATAPAATEAPAPGVDGAPHHLLALAGLEAGRRPGGAQLAGDAQLRPRRISTVPEQSAYSMLMIGLRLLGLHMRRQPQEEKFSVDAPQ